MGSQRLGQDLVTTQQSKQSIQWTLFTVNSIFLSSSVRAQSCLTVCDPTDCGGPGLSVPWALKGKNTGVGIFPTQGWNPTRIH